jgi:hypothetical protein
MLVVTAITMLAVSVGGALAFTGDWYYDDNVGGWEVLRLGDNSDDTFLHLSGATEYCSRPGVSYAKMRNVLVRNGTNGEQIEWWVNASCGDFVRICVRNWRGEQGCSTYWSEGWKDWY